MSLGEVLAGAPALWIGAVLLFGLLVGSFLNVVIHRLPKMLERDWQAQAAEIDGRTPAAALEPYNLVVPRSACPSCGAPIRAYQNVPVVSWLLLRGRCAACGSGISARYPLVELATGLLSAAVAWKFGVGWPALGALLVTWFLVALACIDLDTQLLPDDLTLPLLWLGLGASLLTPLTPLSPFAPGTSLPVDPRASLIGAMVGYLSLWSVYHLFRLVTGKEGMGYGDFKLLAALGAWLGWRMILPIVLMSALVGAVVGIALIALRGRERAAPMAFGPYLAAAGWIVLMFGPEIVSRYLGLFEAPR